MDMDRRDFIKAAAAVLLQAGLISKDTFAAVNTSATLEGKAGGAGNLAEDVHQLFTSMANPEQGVWPGGYWWWFNTLMDKEGITRDLEEFHAKGIGEVLLVNSAANGKNNPIPSGPQILTEGWFELYRFALSEAHRLNMRVGFNLCAGWCMGGPWIKPEESGRWYLQVEKKVTGPRKFSEKLPLPGSHDGYKDVKNPPGIKEYFALPLEKLDYRDTAVIAVPLSPGGNETVGGKRADLLAAKANRMDASNSIRADELMEKPLEPWKNKADDQPIPVDKIVDLTGKLGPDGHLDWDVPEGDWVIIRTGSRMTGSEVTLGLPGAKGLSVDWLNEKGVDSQFKHFGIPIIEASKPYVGNTLAYFCDDSFEDGFPNWTGNIIEKFKEYRGYDPTPYLAALTGYIVGSAEQSDRFLYDYRKTVADLMADGHYKRFADLCHEHGLLVQNESAGPSRSGTMCMDGMKNLGRSDFPMGEFWIGRQYGEPDEEDPKLGYFLTRLEDRQNKIIKMVASASHTFGKNLVSAESFTTTRRIHWSNYPHMLRYAADRAFCEGLNRVMIHTVTGTRPSDGKPGYEYYAGTHFNPNVTWWDQSGGFLSYIARCQNLLRQGLFVADVLYYNGDWAPNLEQAKHVDPDLGKGYDYDACSEEVLLERLSAKDGRLVLPDGMSYRVMVLPDTQRMPLKVLKKIESLVKSGAIVIGPKPQIDAGLEDFPNGDAKVKALADKIWGDCDGQSVTSASYGKGTLYWGVKVRDVLEKLGVGPDLTFEPADNYTDYIHRQSADVDIYYVWNRKKEHQGLSCTFRIAGRKPYLFDPVSGKTRPLSGFNTVEAGTVVKLEFDARQGYFIVFPAKGQDNQTLPGIATADKTQPDFIHYKPIKTLEGPWTVKFDTKWGGPESVELKTLTDWSKNDDKRIQYYSGSAVYSKSFDLTAAQAKDTTLALDLGDVQVIADVTLNGKALGTVWTNPWRIELGQAAKAGTNKLEIKVTNLWPNRLIGDAALPKDQRLTNTNIEFKPDEPLLPSGLLGPVTLQQGS